MVEKHEPGHTNGYKLPRQLKDPKREKMVGTKTGTKVVDKSDPKYKKHPEHESVENEDMSLAPKGKGRKAAKALYKEGEWADEKRKEKESSDRLLKIHQ